MATVQTAATLDVVEMPQPPTAYRWYARLFVPCAERNGGDLGGYVAGTSNRSAREAVQDALRYHDRFCGCRCAVELEYRYGTARHRAGEGGAA